MRYEISIKVQSGVSFYKKKFVFLEVPNNNEVFRTHRKKRREEYDTFVTKPLPFVYK